MKKLAGWGNYPIQKAFINSFKSEAELSEIIKTKSKFISRGMGRSYGDSSLSDNIISTLKFRRILSFDEEQGILDCQSGATLDIILQQIVPKGWFLPVTPGTKYITVGGAVASDIHGKNHHVDGSFRKHIIELEILNESGKTVLCSSTINDELFDLTCGGMGLTGVITRVKFKLLRIYSKYIEQTTIKAKNLDELFGLFDHHSEFPYSVAWIDCLQKGVNMGRGLLILGKHRDNDPSEELESFKVSKPRIDIPSMLPNWWLNFYSMKLFNFLYYNKQFDKVKQSRVSLESFFYPLDFVGNWNCVYGKRGFIQYQFVLPLDRGKEGLTNILNVIAKSGFGSFLTVLKLFGEGEGLLSFPMKGYTLALDFPIRKGLLEFLSRLDAIVLEYGGRIYLTKDARMSKDFFGSSYVRASEFANKLRKWNPTLKWRSRQSDRLDILNI